MAHIGGPQTAATILSAYEPFPIISSSAYSSHAPASWAFIAWNQPTAVAVKNLVFANSMNASVPGATSQASTGSEAFSYQMAATLFSRQGYGASSTNISQMATASVGLTATLSYASTAQSFAMSWVTDTTGGTTSFSTTSNAGNWSSYATGPKLMSMPFVTTIPAGEYFLAFQHSSTTATSNSNVTLLSMSNLIQQWPVVTVGTLGGSVTIGSLGYDGAGFGIASAVTTNNTMALSVISASAQPLIYFALSNAT